MNHDSTKFIVDSDTAEIRTTVTLDREKGDKYMMDLEASDSSLTNPLTAYTNILVYIGDENDNVPKFQKDSVNLYIPDPSLPGIAYNFT